MYANIVFSLQRVPLAVSRRKDLLMSKSIAGLLVLKCIGSCFGFGCHRQQKRHAAAPPPAGVLRRMERKRQKLVGRDKGSLTEQQTEGTVTTTVQIRRKHDTNSHNRPSLPDRTGAVRSQAASHFPPRRPPHRTQHDGTWLCLARWGQPPPPGCAPSWSPVKINPVLAKPRTVAFFESSRFCFGCC